MSLDDDLENLATAAVSDWPEIAFSGRLDGAIRELYRMHLPFPPSWTPDECEEFIEEHADTDAQQLATQFDDAIDVVIDDFGRQNGHLPHHEDASEMIDASRRTMVYELLANIEYLKDELAQLTIHTAGRSPASMTGCSPAARRSHRTTIRRPRGIR
ncbi:MAG: transposase [Mycobacterium sp.]|nr:transposase [Mycobacterium sp.]